MPICEATMISAKAAAFPLEFVVIKVGGSLLDWPELPRRLASFLADPRDQGACLRGRAVLIAGGGAFADLIRTMDQTHALGDQKAHRLAISSLDLTADLLAALLPGSIVVQKPEEVRVRVELGEVPILAPGRLLEEHDNHHPDPLPACWDVSSDSIAARVAFLLGVQRLILLKSAGHWSDIRRDEAARLGLVDALFPKIARPLEVVELVCLRDRLPVPRRLLDDRIDVLMNSSTNLARPGGSAVG
jgi:aspartokinase-like uncharacterized kinase